MTRTEKERQEGRPPRLEPDFRLQSNKDRLLLYERGLMTTIHFVAEGDNATFNVFSLAPTLGVSTPMAVKSNEGRGRTGSLSGRARSLLLPSSPDPWGLTWPLGPHTAPTRSLDSLGQANFGISRGSLRIGTTRCSLPRSS
ncbi:hypothetical protein ALC53_05294 [Atta colombica]|uniref:Uncharacterized protein n=1 Tax=Atta colombica TaxID=520822 RepID=A0A195BI30_9HYME|nr:hypothetical protein ALC53_05294 [Atta colombica]